MTSTAQRLSVIHNKRTTLPKNWIFRSVAIAAAPAIALALTTEAVAYSGNQWVYLQDSRSPVNTAGSMVHVDNGDIFRVYDDFADGHGVRGYLEVNSSGWVSLHSSYNGKGSTSYTQFTRDVQKIYSYRMKVCTFDGIEDTSPVACSPWKYFTE